jgi:hypothetical protein
MKEGIEMGSGNVFADIGLPNADEHPVKAHLVYKISTITHIKAAELSASTSRMFQTCCSGVSRGIG